MSYGGEQEGPSTRPLLRVPHVLLDAAEVQAAVDHLLTQEMFVFDVETTKDKARSNTLLWVGLGAAACTYLIPVAHPKGVTLVREHRGKVFARDLYGLDDPRSRTPKGNISNKTVERLIPAVYGPPPVQLFADEVCEIIRPLLWSDRAKLGHNVKFDCQSVAKYYGDEIPPGPYHDTLILRHVLQEEGIPDYGLKALVYTWFGIPKSERQKFYPNLGDKGITNFGLDDAAVYLAKDLRYCWLMFKRWYDRLLRKGLKAVYDFEMSMYPVVMAMEYAGFPVDPSKLDVVGKDLEALIKEIEIEVWDLAEGQFPLSNLDAKRWVLFGEGMPEFPIDMEKGTVLRNKPLKSQKLKVLSYTPKEKRPQVTQTTLEFYADRNPLANLLLQWSGYEKLRGTFIVGLDSMLRYHDGLPTVHTSFKQHGTVTGRFSSAEPNLQQIPREVKGRKSIRELFVAGPGHTLIVADYDQIELRCAGYLSGDAEMLRVFQAGEDIHRSAAAAMFQILLDIVTEEQRQVGKTGNFSTIYGAGVAKVAFIARCSEARAKEFLDHYYKRFSGLLPWKNKVLAAARAAGDRANAAQPPHVVIPPVGRLRRLPDLYRYNDNERGLRFRAERQAINALVQGFASYITKMAMRELHPVLQEYPAQMIAQVHDEIVVRVENPYLDEVLPLVTSTMSGIQDASGAPILGAIPLIVSANAGYTWASAKGK